MTQRLDHRLVGFVVVCAGLVLASCSDDGGKNGLPDGSAVCKSGELNCDGVCANLATDPNYCGDCKTKCDAPEGADPICVDSKCDIECHPTEVDGGDPIEMTACGNACFDTKSDLENCGGCDKACHVPTDGDATCEAGKCGVECKAGFDQCGDDCFNFVVDGEHCGDCDTACNANQVCANGACVFSCPAGQTACGKSCVDLKTDEGNCGGCDNACPDPGGSATPSCVNYACTLKCDAGTTLCGDKCVNSKTDINNCGGCGKQCSATNGTPSCANSACQIACDANFKNCDGKVKNGCEIDTQTDVDNCGDCAATAANPGTGAVCDPLTVNKYCNGGTCSNACSGSLTACTNHCADLTSAVNDCNACDNVCPDPASGLSTGSPTCDTSTCKLDCRAPTATSCKLGTDSGCVNTKTDPQACSSCSKHCAIGEKCVDSACAADSCGVGLTKVNAGCINEDSDADNCGPSHTVCNGTLVATCLGNNCFCEAGACKAACTAGLTKCNTRDCVDTDTDPANCGGCGKLCTAGQFCEAGDCKDFIYASGCWECGAGNSMNTCCDYGGGKICTDNATCP